MVLSFPDGLTEGIGGLLGVSPEAADGGLWGPHRLAYDAGSSDLAYWEAAIAHIEGAGDADLAELLPSLVAQDVDSWQEIRPAARAILTDLKDQGVPRVVLSNAPTVFADRSPQFSWSHLVDRFFFSGWLGVTKPSSGIYEHLEKALGVGGAELWFIDDVPANVDAALARGWHAHLWVDDADTRAWLVAEGLLA